MSSEKGPTQEKDFLQDGHTQGADNDIEINLDECGRVAGTYTKKLNFSPILFPDLLSSKIAFALADDCMAVNDDDASDASFFLSANDIQKGHFRCALERLAGDIFNLHTKELKNDFNVEKSGAEFWVQVRQLDENQSMLREHDRKRKRSEEDSQKTGVQSDNATAEHEPEDKELEGESICFHFDKDETLSALAGVYVSPALSTVTYLSDEGGPTTILGHVYSADQSTIIKCSGYSECILCYPKVGNHICFDGRLLHGVPSCFRASEQQGQRISFLVNIWINHVPIGIEKLPDKTCDSMSNCSLEKIVIDVNSISIVPKSHCVSVPNESSDSYHTFPLREACSISQLQIPSFPKQTLRQCSDDVYVSIQFEKGLRFG